MKRTWLYAGPRLAPAGSGFSLEKESRLVTGEKIGATAVARTLDVDLHAEKLL